MPLKLWKRPDSKALWVRGTVNGQKVAESTGTADPRQAEAYRAKREGELWTAAVYGQKALATFPDAVTAFLQERPRSDRDKARIGKLLDHFGDTPLRDIGQHSLAGAYAACLRDGADASPGAKLRGVFAPLRSVLENAAVHQMCDRPAMKAPQVPKAATSYLKPEEATRLVEAAAAHLRPLLIFLIGTGSRMAEALELTWDGVDLRGARATVWQKQQNERLVDLPPVVVAALKALPHREGAVFRPDKRGARAPRPGEWQGYADFGRETGGQIKKAWATACRLAGLPGRWREWTSKRGKRLRQWQPEHTPHDCRHTWASWHYCVNRDLLGLREAGGWDTTQMVERYAKRMPDAYRREAIDWLAGKSVVAAAPKRRRKAA